MKQRKCPQVRIMDEDCYDSYGGQLYCRVVAVDKNSGNYLGRIDYSLFEGKTYIDIIEVDKEFRRCGVASKMLDKLEKEQTKINYGLTTREGTEFLRRYKLGKKAKLT